MRLSSIRKPDFKELSVMFRAFPAYLRFGAIALVFLGVLGGVYLLDSGSSNQPHATSSNAHNTSLKKSSPSKDSSSEQSSPQATTPSQSDDSGTTAMVLPAAVLNLTSWKLTLPIGKSGDPDEITQPQLADYSLSPYFQVNSAKNGVQFVAPTVGVTTSGSKFPRSELREMTASGSKEASWSTSQGISTMTVRESIDHLPSKRPQLVAAQIHGADEYIILVRLNGNDLFVEGDGNNLGDLDANYKLGTPFDLQIVAQGGHILVSYNGAQKVDYINDTSGDYFKAGCYTQSNPSYGDGSGSFGQTTIYSLAVSHT